MSEPLPELDDRDIYDLMDRAGLQPSTLLNQKKSLATIVLEIRQKQLVEIKELIKRREAAIKGEPYGK